MSAADFWFSGFVFRSVVTVPYGHEPDSHSLKINVHAYFRRETSGIQNIVFAPKLIPHSHLFFWGGGVVGCSPSSGDIVTHGRQESRRVCLPATKMGSESWPALLEEPTCVLVAGKLGQDFPAPQEHPL